jgi:phage-related holin
MQYILMLMIVVMLAAADIITGFIKGYVTDRPRSRKMRIGGLHKIAEIVVMATAIAVFGFISVMEIVSILENYAEINPDAAWVAKVIKSIKKQKEDVNNGNSEK